MSASISGTIDTLNSSTTPIEAGKFFDGVWADVSTYSSVLMTCLTTQNGILYVEFSDDGKDLDNFKSYSVVANVTLTQSTDVGGKYFRCRLRNSGTIAQTSLSLVATLNTSEFFNVDAEVTSSALPTGAATSALQSTGNNTLKDIESAVGAKTNSAATSDTGTFSLISLFKRLLEKTTDIVSSGDFLLDQDNGTFDAFYRQRFSQPETIFDSKQINDKQPQFWDDQLLSGSGGSSTYNTNQASTTLSVAASTAAVRARQTYRRFNYQPAKSQIFIQTGVWGAAATGIKRKAGLFDANNGIFFDQQSDGMGVTIRTYTGGSASDTRVLQSSWNIDKMDGTGTSGITLDFTKTLIWFTDFEWLGVGSVRFGFFVNGRPYYVHKVNNANVNTLVYMSTPNLPLRYEIENTGTGGAVGFTHICSTVISEGGLKDTGFPYAFDRNGTLLTTNNNNSIYPILGLRLKSGYLGSFIKLLDLSVTCTSTAEYNYMLLLNPTIVGTALTWSNITNSSCQLMNTSTNATTVTGGTKILSRAGQQGNSGGSDSVILNSDFALGSTIAGVSDELYLCVRRNTGTTETFDASMNFKDQQ